MTSDWRRTYDDDAVMFGLLTGIKPTPDVAPTTSSTQNKLTQEQKDATQSVTHK